MHAGSYVFSQMMDHLPWHIFRRCVARYDGDRKIKRFSCHDQFRCLVFPKRSLRMNMR